MFTSITYKIITTEQQTTQMDCIKKTSLQCLSDRVVCSFNVRTVGSYFFDFDRDNAGVTMNSEHYATQCFLATSWCFGDQHGVHDVQHGGATAHICIYGSCSRNYTSTLDFPFWQSPMTCTLTRSISLLLLLKMGSFKIQNWQS